MWNTLLTYSAWFLIGLGIYFVLLIIGAVFVTIFKSENEEYCKKHPKRIYLLRLATAIPGLDIIPVLIFIFIFFYVVFSFIVDYVKR